MRVVVTVAVWLDAMVPAVAVKLAEAAPADTVTEPGTASSALLEDNATATPPEAAAALRATVQVPELLEDRLLDAQLSEERAAGAAATERLSVPEAVSPLLSSTCTVKVAAAAAVGVPLIVPATESTRPAGREPAVKDQLYGAVPPLAAKVCAYAVPAVPFGSVVVAIVTLEGAGAVVPPVDW